jgi:hypothetical protein
VPRLRLFTGVIKEGGCLRIDQLIASSVILNIQIWFLSKDVPKFTVGDLSDFSCIEAKIANLQFGHTYTL